jgi:quercetin dioxygenase-like cupin family protein
VISTAASSPIWSDAWVITRSCGVRTSRSTTRRGTTSACTGTPTTTFGWHDHDTSSGAVAVVEGSLLEQNLAVGSPDLSRRVDAGNAFDFGPDHIHRISGLAAGSVSIHAYSPPLWRLGQYTIDRSGALRRTSVSYAEELRPVTESTG